jgi:acyl-ACP thioesterase
VSDLVPMPSAGRTFTGERPVRVGDVSPRGRMRLDALVRYLQDVSTDDTADSGLVDADGWVVRRTLVEVDRFPIMGERLRLTTWCSGTGSHWAERRIKVVGDRGAAADASALWVHVDLATGRPRRLPPQFLELYGEAAGGRTLRARLVHPDPAPDAEHHPWPTRVTDFDVLGHINNASYWVVVEEELARRRDLRAPLRAEVEHRSAIEPGEAVEVAAIDGADGTLSIWVTGPSGVAATAVVRRESVDAPASPRTPRARPRG